MKIVTNTHPFKFYKDNKKILKLIKDAGFDAYDFSMLYLEEGNDLFFDSQDYVKKAKELRKYADEIGLPCVMAHAPFPVFYPGDENKTKARFDEICRSMEIASILGAKIIVVHPYNNWTPEENKEFYLKLLPLAKKLNIKIALENMWNWKAGEPRASFASCSTPKDFLDNISLLPKDTFTCCLDIGHAEIMEDTSSVDIIKTLGPYLGALHIHDNDKVHDNHSLPYTEKVDFEAIIKALKEINYKGDVTLEVESLTPRLPLSSYPEAAKLMYKIARHIYDELML